jgi:hypothetical protein
MRSRLDTLVKRNYRSMANDVGVLRKRDFSVVCLGYGAIVQKQ